MINVNLCTEENEDGMNEPSDGNPKRGRRTCNRQSNTQLNLQGHRHDF